MMMSQINDSAGIKTRDSERSTKEKTVESKPTVQKVDDNLSLSETSKQLELLKNALKNIAETNLDKILHFKTEIALGNYQIDSSKIASKMLDSEIA